MLHAILLAVATGPCDANMAQQDLNQCWGAQSAKADALLKAATAKAAAELKKLGIAPGVLGAVVSAGDAMSAQTCAFEGSLYEGGSIEPMIRAMCEDRTARAQAQRLTNLVATLQSKGAVAALAPVSPKVDAELNRVYGLYLKQQLTAQQRKAFIDAEVAWLAYRDAACKLEGGDCSTALEQERTSELEAGWIGEQFW